MATQLNLFSNAETKTETNKVTPIIRKINQPAKKQVKKSIKTETKQTKKLVNMSAAELRQQAINFKKEVNFQRILTEAVNSRGQLLEAYRAFHNFSLGNMILASMQCKDQNIAVGPMKTFKQWKEYGRQVKKGSKAINLCMPVQYSKRVKETNEETGEEETKTVYGKRRFVYRSYWFVLDQTKGDKEINWNKELEWNKEKALKELKIELIKYDYPSGNTQGYAVDRKIAINPLAQLPEKTLFHELAHVVLEHTKEGKSNELSKEIKEVEAEATALLVLEALGLKGSAYCRGYIQAYWGRGNEIPEKSCQRIIKAADTILKAGNK